MKYKYLALLLVLSLCSCATVKLEYALPSQSLDAPIAGNKTRVIFFNDSNPVLFGDGSWRIGIKLDGKGVENLHLRRYVLVDLSSGPHNLELNHVDVFTFRDSYDLEVSGKTMYIKVYNGIISTKYKILESKPENFEKRYRPV